MSKETRIDVRLGKIGSRKVKPPTKAYIVSQDEAGCKCVMEWDDTGDKVVVKIRY